MKLETSNPPDSCVTALATSNSVVSTGKLLVMVLEGVCKRNRVLVYADAGLLTILEDIADPNGAETFGAWPSRSAFAFSAFSRLSSLSAAISSLNLCLAAISSCFSRFLAAATISQEGLKFRLRYQLAFFQLFPLLQVLLDILCLFCALASNLLVPLLV